MNTKIIVAFCLFALALAEPSPKKAADLETDSTYGLGYAAGYGGLYGGLGYSSYYYPSSYYYKPYTLGYGYYGSSYPKYSYGYGHGYYGSSYGLGYGYPSYGHYYG